MPRIEPRAMEAPGISAPFAGLGLSVAIGVAEWLRVALSRSLTAEELQSGLLLICAVYGALGLAAGLAAWIARRAWAAPALVVALIGGLAAGANEPRPILRLAAVALGLIILRLASVLLARLPALPRARIACSAALVGIAAVCGLAARAIPAFGPRWAAGAAVAALAGTVLVWAPRVRASGALAAGAALALAWQGSQHTPRIAPEVAPAPNAASVLLVTIDTLRADRVGAYGYAQARTPTLDSLAREGVLFRNAFAPSMFTGPSHASILSSRSPAATGFLINHQGLDDRFETLAESLRRAGYVTAAFPSSYTTAERSSHLPARFQFSDGETREHSRFPEPVYRCVLVRALEPRLKGPSTWPSYRPAAATTDRAVHFLGAHAGVPTFAWVHYFDPHLPYAPPAELRSPDAALAAGDWYALTAEQRRALLEDPPRVDAMRGLYDAEVAYVDRELGRLIEAARQAAPPGGVLLVVTSDHGEPMGEHGRYWRRDLHDVTLHVPLVLVPPGAVADWVHSVDADVRLIDVAPTILDWLGLPPLAEAEGTSLRPLATGAATASPGPAVAVHDPEPDEFSGRSASVRRAGWKLIRLDPGLWAPDRWEPGEEQLFDVAGDPGELANLRDQKPEIAGELQQLLPEGWSPGPKRELSPEEREQLRALGYLQ